MVQPPARLPLSGSQEPYQVKKEGHLLVGSGISGYLGGTQEERKQPVSIGIAGESDLASLLTLKDD